MSATDYWTDDTTILFIYIVKHSGKMIVLSVIRMSEAYIYWAVYYCIVYIASEMTTTHISRSRL